jgi:PPK2 family polyphosphate:nucleotide phosphotransferase
MVVARLDGARVPRRPDVLRRDHLVAPHSERLASSDPRYGEITERHAAALAAGEPAYLDPATGRSVFTAAFLASRGDCCASGCRHCPYVGAEVVDEVRCDAATVAAMSTKALHKVVDKLRVAPGEKVRLDERSTNDTLGMDKADAPAAMTEMKASLDLLQQRLYAEGRRSVLLVVQAMDAAGKDGTIRNTLSGLNPAGIQVTSFKAPGGPEVAHDFLWRVHSACPSRGDIGVFNRSHYEDVLVVRVKKFVPEKQWRGRYHHIREFERLLHDEGTSVIKCFLHVSKEKQAERLQARLDDPEKHWKFRAADLQDRELWDDYQRAYCDAIRETSTIDAPWFIVPADRNWVRNLAVARILLETLEALDPKVPLPEPGLDKIKVV